MANEARKIQQAQIRLQKELHSAVNEMGVEAKKFFTTSFRNQGFTDVVLERWQQRKRQDRGNKSVRAILVKTGNLRKSIRVINKNYKSVTLGSDLPYAEVHNEGLRAGRGRGFKMPKRQFIGDSRKLTDLLIGKIHKRIHKVFR